MDDLISRQAAIKVVKGIDSYFVKYIEQLPSAHPDGRYINADELIKRLKGAGHEEAAAMALKMAGHERKKNLPPVQPEPLTDKEQRIFLAAMGREEKVCEEVDRNYVREPYEDSLMRVCKEIRRKVKGALWT